MNSTASKFIEVGHLMIYNSMSSYQEQKLRRIVILKAVNCTKSSFGLILFSWRKPLWR